jgi:hypothetical protein
MDRELDRRVTLSEGPTRRATLHTLSAVQRSAEKLRADADRVLARCLVGEVDPVALTEEMHSIDQSASMIRYEIARLHGDGDSTR